MLEFLAAGAVVDASAQVAFFDYWTAADRAGFAGGVLAESGFITPRPAKQILFRVPAALGCHFRQGIF
jgi:hypothetical protein